MAEIWPEDLPEEFIAIVGRLINLLFNNLTIFFLFQGAFLAQKGL
jgi:hypothetical protein